MDLEKTTTVAPDVDQLAREKPQKEPKLSTEGADFCTREILEIQKFFTVSTKKSNTYLFVKRLVVITSSLWQELAKQAAAHAQKLQQAR